MHAFILRSLLAALAQHQQLHRAFLGGLSTQDDDLTSIKKRYSKVENNINYILKFYLID